MYDETKHTELHRLSAAHNPDKSNVTVTGIVPAYTTSVKYQSFWVGGVRSRNMDVQETFGSHIEFTSNQN